jgi:bacteriorhodopsin
MFVITAEEKGPDMPTLSTGEYTLVYNAFSFVFAAMFATFIFLVLSRAGVAPKYRNAVTMSALVVAIAGYHYFRIFESWQAAFVLTPGANGAAASYTASGSPFNDAYRYIDWLLTVPLLTAELIAVMAITGAKKTSLTIRLAGAAALMVALGYPGEIASDIGTRTIWGVISTIPFLYIVYELFVGLGPAIQQEKGNVKGILSNVRWLMLATWGFYPIVYSIPLLTGGAKLSATAVIAVQVGYCIADVLAKCGYGVIIYNIARLKSEGEPVTAAGTYAPASGD